MEKKWVSFEHKFELMYKTTFGKDTLDNVHITLYIIMNLHAY